MLELSLPILDALEKAVEATRPEEEPQWRG